MVLYTDNAAALALVFDDEYQPHSRHIVMKYYRVRELVGDCSAVDLQYCPTRDMVVVRLTKGLEGVKQDEFIQMCGLV